MPGVRVLKATNPNAAVSSEKTSKIETRKHEKAPKLKKKFEGRVGNSVDKNKLMKKPKLLTLKHVKVSKPNKKSEPQTELVIKDEESMEEVILKEGENPKNKSKSIIILGAEEVKTKSKVSAQKDVLLVKSEDESESQFGFSVEEEEIMIDRKKKPKEQSRKLVKVIKSKKESETPFESDKEEEEPKTKEELGEDEKHKLRARKHTKALKPKKKSTRLENKNEEEEESIIEEEHGHEKNPRARSRKHAKDFARMPKIRSRVQGHKVRARKHLKVTKPKMGSEPQDENVKQEKEELKPQVATEEVEKLKVRVKKHVKIVVDMPKVRAGKTFKQFAVGKPKRKANAHAETARKSLYNVDFENDMQEEELMLESEKGEKEVEEFETSSSYDHTVEWFEEEHFVIEDDAYSFDLHSSESDEFERVTLRAHRPKVKKEKDFCCLLGQWPNIDEVSLTESITSEISNELVESFEEVDEEIIGEAETFDAEEWTSEYSEFDYEFETSELEEIPHASESESIEDLFVNIVMKDAIQVDFQEYDPELDARLREQKRIKKDAAEFLSGLIDAVVEVSEYVDPRDVLRRSLDKVKMFKQLIRLLENLYSERKVSEFLNNKCVQYYRRLKDFRPIKLESAGSLPIIMQKYKETLDRLDCLAAKESALKATNAKKILETEELVTELEQKVDEASSKLENVMRNTFKVRRGDNIARMTDRSIKEITNLRKEISSVREIVIQRQHNNSKMLDKMYKLENISDTLHLQDYERMLIEEYSVSKKLEEKSDRLVDVQRKFNNHTSIVAHIREKQSMSLHAMRYQMKTLNVAKTEKRNLHNYVHQLRLNSIKLKKEIQERSFENGLIGQQVLLIDFDETLERGQEIKAKVNALKDEIIRLENKIGFLEKRALCNYEG